MFYVYRDFILELHTTLCYILCYLVHICSRISLILFLSVYLFVALFVCFMLLLFYITYNLAMLSLFSVIFQSSALSVSLRLKWIATNTVLVLVVVVVFSAVKWYAQSSSCFVFFLLFYQIMWLVTFNSYNKFCSGLLYEYCTISS